MLEFLHEIYSPFHINQQIPEFSSLVMKRDSEDNDTYRNAGECRLHSHICCAESHCCCLKPAMSSSVTEHQAYSLREEWRALLDACPVS